MAKKRTKDPLAEFMIQDIAAQAKDEAKDLLKHISAIYRVNSISQPEQSGTGILLHIGDRHFLLTAAHVLDDTEDYDLFIPSNRSGALIPLEGDSFKSVAPGGNREDDLIDIAVVSLKPQTVDEIGSDSFLSISMVDVDDIGEQGATYIAMGYPGKKNAKANWGKRKYKRIPISYTANILPEEKLSGMGLRRASHLLISFKKRHSRNDAGRDITAPDPDGMSGGPLWRLNTYSDEKPSSRLVGILIKWCTEVGGILTVRLPILLTAIALHCPELAGLVPKTRTLRVCVAEAAPPDP